MAQTGSLVLLVVFALTSCAPYNHSSLAGSSGWDAEFAHVEERSFKYEDATFKSLSTGEPVLLSSLMHGKSLVMVVYFAPWCPNWQHEMPLVAKLYERYKAQGFSVIGISEYGPAADTRSLFASGGISYPVLVESEDRAAQNKTTHSTYRRDTGDTRKWGSPWHVFIEPAQMLKKGPYLLEKAWVVNGELMQGDADAFIRRRLKIESAL